MACVTDSGQRFYHCKMVQVFHILRCELLGEINGAQSLPLLLMIRQLGLFSCKRQVSKFEQHTPDPEPPPQPKIRPPPIPQIPRFMGPTWGPSGADRTQVDPMWAPWTLLSGPIFLLLFKRRRITSMWNADCLVLFCRHMLFRIYIITKLGWHQIWNSFPAILYTLHFLKLHPTKTNARIQQNKFHVCKYFYDCDIQLKIGQAKSEMKQNKFYYKNMG